MAMYNLGHIPLSQTYIDSLFSAVLEMDSEFNNSN